MRESRFVEVLLFVPLGVDRDDVEDALVDAFDGGAEVTGAGWADEVANLDLEVESDLTHGEIIDRVRLGLNNSSVRSAEFRLEQNWLVHPAKTERN